jgi:hypothetical protein
MLMLPYLYGHRINPGPIFFAEQHCRACFCNTSRKYKFGQSILIYVSLVKFNWETLDLERPEQKLIQNYFLQLF